MNFESKIRLAWRALCRPINPSRQPAHLKMRSPATSLLLVLMEQEASTDARERVVVALLYSESGYHF